MLIKHFGLIILANLSADTHSWQVGNQVLLATTDLEIYVLYLRTSQSKIAQILHAAMVPSNANNVFNEKMHYLQRSGWYNCRRRVCHTHTLKNEDLTVENPILHAKY